MRNRDLIGQAMVSMALQAWQEGTQYTVNQAAQRLLKRDLIR